MKKLLTSIKSVISKKDEFISQPKNSKMQDQKSQFSREVQIDEQWISTDAKEQHMVDPNLLMCMICYGIPLGDYAECANCGRIFCYRDFNEVAQKHNCCPNCKVTPFVKRPKPHVLYTSLFERIRFCCQICKQVNQSNEGIEEKKVEEKMVEKKIEEQKAEGQMVEKLEKNIQVINVQQNQSKIVHKQKTFSKQQLYDHINDSHKANIMDFNLLYEFQIIFDQNSEKTTFDLYQNIELNQKIYDYQNKRQGHKQEFAYQQDSGNYLVINLKKQTARSLKTNKEGKLIKKLSKTLKKDTQYHVWEIQLDSGFKYYTQKYQHQIDEEYKKFMNNKRLNQFIMEIEGQRYRVSFSKMRQINTYSNFERVIRRTTIRFA